MAILTWDDIGEHTYETGVDHGVLYIPDEDGDYATGVPWNGLTNVTESPTGGEANPQYADNIKYLTLVSVEEYGLTVEALTYPPEFEQFDGLVSPHVGISIGQQPRKGFGFSYRTLIGNDLEGNDYGYKLHLVYGCLATPSEKAHNTINDSPEAVPFSWEVTTTPVPVTGHKPTSMITVDSTTADPEALSGLEDLLYGTGLVVAALPMPDAVIALFA